MDLIKAKSILGRLQAMHQALEFNPQLSSLERDLILNYLRDLYNIYLDADVQVMPTIKPISNAPSHDHPIEKEVVQKTLEFRFDPVDEPLQTHEPKTIMPSEIQIAPMVHPAEVEVKHSEAQKPYEPVVTFVQPSIPVTPPIAPKSHIVRASIQELFEVKKGTELSDKLHELPLKDINRAIGINDRLEMVAGLFGGQKPLFEQAISELNNLKSFEEASELLGLGPALQFKWDHEDHKEKAIEFIKLIRRRYL
ncbi:MAG: hypothetical protein ABI761_00635 [Saprospiraceae bacterium]